MKQILEKVFGVIGSDVFAEGTDPFVRAHTVSNAVYLLRDVAGALPISETSESIKYLAGSLEDLVEGDGRACSLSRAQKKEISERIDLIHGALRKEPQVEEILLAA